MMIENAPCYKCENRKALCHSTCKEYIEWKAQQSVIKEKEKNERRRYTNYVDYAVDRKIKINSAKEK